MEGPAAPWVPRAAFPYNITGKALKHNGVDCGHFPLYQHVWICRFRLGVLFLQCSSYLWSKFYYPTLAMLSDAGDSGMNFASADEGGKAAV